MSGTGNTLAEIVNSFVDKTYSLRHPITCMELSDNGACLATGEMATLGTRVLVVCWDTSTWNMVGSHQTHHAKVEALALSPDNTKVML